jgi:hypothetical protein
MAEPKRPEFDVKNLNQDNASWKDIGPEIRAVFLREVDDALTNQGEKTASRVLDWIYGDYKEAILVAYREAFNEPRDNVKRVYPKVFTVTTDLRSDEFNQLRRRRGCLPRSSSMTYTTQLRGNCCTTT